VQGPTINHEGLRKRLKAAEDYLKNASAHVTNFLRTIEQAKADGTINEQLLNELAGLQDSILRLVRNNEEIAQFMFKELYGFTAVRLNLGLPLSSSVAPVAYRGFGVSTI
jgi:hypothetical protein